MKDPAIKNPIIAIIGATATGKSDLAISVAKKYNGEVISADSRQVYRGMTIGSGKETGIYTLQTNGSTITRHAYMIDTIPHYMIDIADPSTQYSLGKFLNKANMIRKDILHRNKLPIICGGTMFWVQALIDDHTLPHVVPNAALRSHLEHLTTDALFSELFNIDPQRAQNIDSRNRHRLIRAIEIATELGCVPPLTKSATHNCDALILNISFPREILRERIALRLTKRINEGMLAEVQSLHDHSSVSWSRLEGFGLEYKWCALFLQKKVSYDEMLSSLSRDICRYAKRQETWIRRWKKQGADIHDVSDTQKAFLLIDEFLSSIY